MSSNYSQIIIGALNRFLDFKGHPTVNPDNTVFAMDADVEYETAWAIPNSKLIQFNKFDEVLASRFADGPSWIHANLIPTNDQRSLITIAVGDSIGNPSPHINVSFEEGKIIEVVNQ